MLTVAGIHPFAVRGLGSFTSHVKVLAFGVVERWHLFWQGGVVGVALSSGEHFIFLCGDTVGYKPN